MRRLILLSFEAGRPFHRPPTGYAAEKRRPARIFEKEAFNVRSTQGENGSRSSSPTRASRAVNKKRARSGESETSSWSSTRGRSASSRGGKQSGQGPGGRTREQLYNDAKKLGIEGRSKMSKDELQHAVAGAS